MQVQHTFYPEEENCMCAMHTARAWHVGATCMQPRFQFMLCVPTAQAHAHGTWWAGAMCIWPKKQKQKQKNKKILCAQACVAHGIYVQHASDQENKNKIKYFFVCACHFVGHSVMINTQVIVSYCAACMPHALHAHTMQMWAQKHVQVCMHNCHTFHLSPCGPFCDQK